MKKFVIILSVVLFVSSGWYFLNFYYRNKTVDAWDLVNRNTMMVYESEAAVKTWNELVSTPAWNIIGNIEALDSLNKKLALLDSLSGSNGRLERLLFDKPLLVSFHKVSTNKIDHVIFISLNNTEKRNILGMIISGFTGNMKFTSGLRKYQDIDLYEIRNKTTGAVFTYFTHKDQFIGSFTPFLVEDVVRNINEKYRLGFRSAFGDILKIPAVDGDAGNLYFNSRELPSLVTTFCNPAEAGAFNRLPLFSGPGYFDINLEKNRILMNGITLASTDTSMTLLKTVSDQTPSEINCYHLMPSSTSWMIDFTFGDFSSWRMETDKFWERTANPDMRKKTAFLDKYSILEREFYDQIGHELCLAELESPSPDNPARLLFIEAADTSGIMLFMNNLARTVNYSIGDTLYFENYGPYTISRLTIDEFPSSLFGKLFAGFDNSFYTLYGKFLVIGNSAEAVKSLLDDINDDDTWGKSVNFVQYFDNIQKSANISLFVNLNRSYGFIYNMMDKKWQSIFKQYEKTIRQFEILSIQFVNINYNIYGSLALQHGTSTATIERPKDFLSDQVVAVESKIATRPFVVRNHLDRSLEVMIQDTTGRIYLVSSGGDILWNKKLDHMIRGDLFQVDYYLNGKLQYLFCTGSQLHLIDRNGNDVTNFPVSLGDSLKMEWLNIIDYDNSRNYRYIAADSLGRVFMYDKYGKSLEGWGGKALRSRLVQAPFHIRVQGRDCIIAVEKRGNINVLNRQGSQFPGFPLDLEGKIDGPVFVQPGQNFTRTTFHAVNSEGELISFNLEGKIIDRSQLYRSGRNNYYELIIDKSEGQFVISRQDYNKVSLMTRAGESRLEKDLLFTDKLKIQYYSFGTNNEIFAFTDSQQEFTYLFNGEGMMINNQPVENSFPIALVYSEANSRFRIYGCYGNQLRILSFF
ncbi:MAG TPA: hypothetical protein VI583_15110, partial [Cyclobacteriaceae bacterium]|nr:hypothetical protein [Cyclobacteriaceae bacterium]